MSLFLRTAKIGMVTQLLLICFVLLLFPYSSFADFTSPILSALDGDTIEVLNGHHTERIRLSGIDCPENGQAYGKRAKHAASDLAFGKDITLQTHGHDKYKRILGDVVLPDGMNLNQELVKGDWCWWYRKYAPGDTVLEGLENVPVPDGFDGLVEVRW
jgi:endonuclease YncB( thermonuclease family)